MADFVPHDLTTNTSHSPYKVSTFSISGGTYDTYKIFDGNLTTYWVNGVAGAPWEFVQIDLDTVNGVRDILPHNLASNSSNSPIVVSASSIWSGTFDAWYVLNGSSSGYWVSSSTSSGWWKIDFGAGTTWTVISYEIAMNNEPNRAPKNWTFEGSNDNTNWTVLDTVTNQTSWRGYETRGYTCDDISTAYRYFRFNISANNGDAALALGEVYFYRAETNQNARKSCKYYSIKVNSIPEPARAPKNWQLLGSNDFGTWDVLDTVTNEMGWLSGELRTYVCDAANSSNAYQIFKLYITANNGDSYFAMAELYMYDAFPSPQVYDVTTVYAEVLLDETANAFITNAPVELLTQEPPNAIITNLPLEILNYEGSYYRFTQAFFETLSLFNQTITPNSIVTTSSVGTPVIGVNPSKTYRLGTRPGALFLGSGSLGQSTDIPPYIDPNELTSIVGWNKAKAGINLIPGRPGIFSLGTIYATTLQTFTVVTCNPRKWAGFSNLVLDANSYITLSLPNNPRSAIRGVFSRPQHISEVTNVTSHPYIATNGLSGYYTGGVHWTTVPGSLSSAGTFVYLNTSSKKDGQFGNVRDIHQVNMTFPERGILCRNDAMVMFSVASNLLSSSGLTGIYTYASVGVWNHTRVVGSMFRPAVYADPLVMAGEATATFEAVYATVLGGFTAAGSSAFTAGAVTITIGALTSTATSATTFTGGIANIQGSAPTMVGTTSSSGTGTTLTPESGYYSFTIQEVENTSTCPGVLSFDLGGTISRSECDLIGSFMIKDTIGPSRTAGYKNFHRGQSSIGYDPLEFTLFNIEGSNTQIDPTLTFTIGGVTTVGSTDLVGSLLDKTAVYFKRTNLFTTQLVAEQIGWRDANAQVTQIVVEQIGVPTPKTRVSQVVVEAIKLANFAAVNHVAIEEIHGGMVGVIHTNSVAVEALMSAKSTAFVTQTAVEQLGKGTPIARVTQLTVELIRQRTEASNAFSFAQQVAVEIFGKPPSKAQVEQVVLETLHNNSPRANVEGVAVEVAHNNDRRAQVAQEAVEAVHNASNRKAMLSELAVEMLVKAEWDPTVSSLVNNPKFHV